MFRPLTLSHRQPPRRGTSFILIVVIMVAMFAAVGTAYVLYAMQQAKTALYEKDAAGGGGTAPLLTGPDPTSTVNVFFGSLIYDVSYGNANQADLNNALRGHSIARSMYGFDSALFNSGQVATTPWNGVGPFQDTNSQGSRNTQVNYTPMFFSSSGKYFLIDPEYMGERTIVGSIPQFNPANSTYVGKNAGYSYPDTKDFFLASVDPVTGQVLLPSFYRPWLFSQLVGTYTGPVLGPNSPIWQNPQGRLASLRPWPTDHPQFPQLPPNADGSYTGDVQNLTGGVGVQMNDSMWMNLGLPVITLPSGQKVQPLVAPLIVPLNGLLNASVHGNVFYGGSHGSYAGYGPWEVNMGYVLPQADAATIVSARGTPQQRSGINTQAYAPYIAAPLPSYSPVAWTNGVVSFPAYPTGATLTGLPTFTGFQNNDAPVTNHPALFNPTEWPTTAGSPGSTFGTFPLGDIKRLQTRYAGTPYWYGQSQLAPLSTALLGNNVNFPFNIAQQQSTTNTYRLDPAHANRMLFTTRGYDIARPKLVPNFASTGTLILAANTTNPTPGLYTPKVAYQGLSSYPSPASGTWAAGSDFTAANRWSNTLAALGAVDLNRPLADYRGNNTGQPLSQTNMGGQVQADQDRRKLAHDIFVRLAAATGAGGITINLNGTQYPTGGTGSYQYQITATSPSTQYDALRYLAQLAVNIVDYIDNDDISTAFVWNPITATAGGPTNYTMDPATDPTNFATTPLGNSPAGQIGLSVVFGHEKTRLVINEAYSEITNDPATMPLPMVVGGVNQPLPANANAHVRFWLELLNPSSMLNPATSPMGNGQVSLSAYQIEIRRETRLTGVAMNNGDTGALNSNQYPYLFNNTANPTGSFNQNMGAADIVLNLSANNTTVSPNNSTFNGGAAANGANGMVLLGPSIITSNSIEFNPDTTSVPWKNAIFIGAAPTAGGGAGGGAPGSPSMAYTLTMPSAQTLSSPEFRRHIILLRRQANPYLGVVNATNPFITVDMMDYVPSFDAVYVASGQANPRVSRPMANPANDGTEYDPITQRFSVGKVQPYAGHAFAVVNQNSGQQAYGQYNQYSFAGNAAANPYTPGSMVLNQVLATNNNTTVVNGNNTPGQPGPMNTFGMHNSATGNMPTAQTYKAPAAAGQSPTLIDPTANSAQTLMVPFDWLPQWDRPLVNELELLSIRDTAPHRVTDQFVFTSNTTAAGSTIPTGVAYHFGAAPWLSDGYTRALEFLTVKPYVMGVPHGGRVPGKINVNVLRDQRILYGLLDPYNPGTNAQTGNGFDSSFVTSNAWSWLGTRQNNGVTTMTRADGTAMATAGTPGQSVFDTNPAAASIAGNDQPFLPFGAPVATNGGTLAYSYVSSGSALSQTILRRNAGAQPYLFANAGSRSSSPVTYPSNVPNGPIYMQSEPVRKILNNVTTVNHQYAVFLTIGYFNVVGTVTVAPGVTIPQLGAEAYITVPGDMRQKFVGVVDMSNMGLDPVNSAPATRPTTLASNLNWQPFFTSVEQTAYGNGTAATGTLNIAYSAYDGTYVYVAADGQQVPFTTGSNLVIGYGSEQQIVTVTGVSVPMGSQFAAVNVQTVNNSPFRTVWAGTCVSNVRPGYPGPQAGFDYTSPTYQPVLPYIERLK